MRSRTYSMRAFRYCWIIKGGREFLREPTMNKLTTIFATTASAAPEGFNSFDGSACYCVDA